ncbi:hypothetical protein PRZ48_007877 [Zasmidium cellare]|uniref:Uncharacterized protein n=1 Tax=Zasmidium cellare TaxID=395010 RepID=A0ABR0EKH7_ZASCE|nr:hypothetical protein PRZ48_007877 [Zasmidium cellare]
MDNSPLVKVPAEVRNSIYELVIGDTSLDKDTTLAQACQVPLARVCKQMRTECLPMCFADITAYVNIVSNFQLPFNHRDEVATLDHHWGFCRSRLIKGASNIMAIAQRIRLLPQACYDGLSQLKLCIILDGEDYGFGLAWQVWEPHLRALADVLKQRCVYGDRLTVRLEYHTYLSFYEESGDSDLEQVFEAIGLPLHEVLRSRDLDLIHEMDFLCKVWHLPGSSVAWGPMPNYRRAANSQRPSHMPNFYSFVSRWGWDRDTMKKEAEYLLERAKARGEVIGGPRVKHHDHCGSGWTLFGREGKDDSFWFPTYMVRHLLRRHRYKMLAASKKAVVR